MTTKLTRSRLLLVLCVTIFASFNLKAVLCTALGNGDWNTAANWSCGFKPGCGDSVVIPAAYTVSITTQQDYSACASGPNVVIYGVLKFINGNKLKLPCDARIYIMPGGSVQAGGGGGNSNNIEICNDVVWNAGDGTLTGPSCLPTTSAWCNSVVLPVELIYFSGEAKDGYIDFNWSTATEINSSHFDVERSPDATVFTKIVTVNSKAVNGNSQSVLNYSASDNSPISNVSYYRLKQVDKDNTSEYSSIISINYIKAKNVKFVVYPNPNKGEFTVDISGIENDHEVTISLKDEKGDLVYNSGFYMQDAVPNKFQIIPSNKLANGVYICCLTLEEIEYHVKVIVN